MTNPPPSRADRHPLEDDLPRLERIADVMWHEIHKVINRKPPRRRRGTSAINRVLGEPVAEQIIKGVALSPTDILSEAVHALLASDPIRVEKSWEAYAVGIAQNKAKGALRTSQAWLYGTEHRTELRLVSGDEPASVTTSGDPGPSVFDTLESNDPGTEEEFLATAQQAQMIRLGREMLDDRDRTIFFGLQFEGRSRQDLAEQFGLTKPGVVYIWKRADKKIRNHPRFPGGAQ